MEFRIIKRSIKFQKIDVAEYKEAEFKIVVIIQIVSRFWISLSRKEKLEVLIKNNNKKQVK